MKPEKFTILQRSSLALFCIIYVVVRLWDLDSACLWFDEIFSVHAAEHPWTELGWFVAQDLIHPPLFYILLKFWIAAGGEGLLWLRSFSVVASAFALAPFLFLCRELKLKFSATLIALVLFAVNGALIKYAQEVRMYSLLLFMSLISSWLFARFYFRGKNIWILTFVNVLLVYVHYFAWFVIAAEIAVIIVFQRIKLRHVTVMAGIVFLSFVPWLLMITKARQNGADINQNIGWIGRPTLTSFAATVIDLLEPFYFQQSSVDPSSVLAISVPIVFLFAGATAFFIFGAKRREETDNVYLLLMFAAIPLVLAFALSWFMPYSVWGTRHLIIVFAPSLTLAAIFVTEVPQRTARAAMIGALAVILLAAFGVRLRADRAGNVWCVWEGYAAELRASDPGGSSAIYVFEDLIAYHLWFALRDSDRFRVKVVKGIEGLTEDTAYFLPRGFDGVEAVSANGIAGDHFWIAYRASAFDLDAPPLSTIANAGYQFGEPRVTQAGTEKAFLVEVQRRKR